LLRRDPERFVIDNPDWDKIVYGFWKKIDYTLTDVGLPHPPPVEGAYLDCLPVDANTLLMFLLFEGEFRVWRAEWKELQDRKKTHVKWSEKPVLKIATDIHEPFVLYGTPSRLFLVTESGTLHFCLNAEKGGRKTELLWTGDPRPIRVVISDAASGKDFAFAPAPKGSAKDVASVYFEISDDLGPVPYDAAKLKEYKPEEQLKTVVEHARFLLAEKKIKP
jgi:hypothetical protein